MNRRRRPRREDRQRSLGQRCTQHHRYYLTWRRLPPTARSHRASGASSGRRLCRRSRSQTGNESCAVHLPEPARQRERADGDHWKTAGVSLGDRHLRSRTKPGSFGTGNGGPWMGIIAPATICTSRHLASMPRTANQGHFPYNPNASWDWRSVAAAPDRFPRNADSQRVGHASRSGIWFLERTSGATYSCRR